jgi:hypothetical protein
MTRRPRRSLEGSVYTETLLVIPVFLTIIGLVILIHDAHSTSISTSAQTRNAALGAATRGCGSLPPGCSTESVGGLDLPVPASLAGSVRAGAIRRVRCQANNGYSGGSIAREQTILCMEDPSAGTSETVTGVAPSLR